MHYKHYDCTEFYTFNIILEPNGIFLNWLLSTATCFLFITWNRKSCFPASSIPKQILIFKLTSAHMCLHTCAHYGILR